MITTGFTDKNGIIADNSVITLEKNAVYDIYEDDCIEVRGYYASNTATKEQNPDGYRPTAFYLKNARNITIDGNGARLVIHGIMTPYVFYGIDGLTLKNLTLDYAHPTMSEFYVESQNGNEAIIRVHDDCLWEIDDGVLFWHGEKGKNGEYYWKYPYRGSMIISAAKNRATERTTYFSQGEEGLFPCVPEVKEWTPLGNNRIKLELAKDGERLPVGSTVQTRHTQREQLGGICERCRNVCFENLEINSIHGFGLLFQFCDNVTVNNVRIIPANGRTIASNADFIQCSGCKGKVTVSHCRFSDGHDDFINIHGTHLKIAEVQENGKKLLLRFMNPCSWGFEAFVKGDDTELIDRKTLLPYGKGKVTAVERLNDTDILLTLDNNTLARQGDVVENTTWTPEVLITKNSFGPSLVRGVLCLSKKKVEITDNRFYKLGGAVLCIEDDANFWYESGYTTNILFENNDVIECGDGVPVISILPQVIDKDSHAMPHKLVAIRNNYFKLLDGAFADAEIRNTEKVIFENNRVSRPLRLCIKDVQEAKLTDGIIKTE